MRFGYTIDQLHNEIDIGIQSIASNDYTRFSSAQIDSIIYRATLNVMRKKYSLEQQGQIVKTLGNDLKGYTDISELIVKNKRLNLFKPSNTSDLFEPDMVYTILPDNFFLMMPSPRLDTSYSEQECDQSTTVTFAGDRERATVVCSLPRVQGDCKYYKGFAIAIGGTKGSTITGADFTMSTEYGVTAIPEKENPKYAIISAVMNYYNNIPDIEVYWEKYNDKFVRNSFIFVFPYEASSTSTDYTVSITYTTTSNGSETNQSITGLYSKEAYKYENTGTAGTLPSYRAEILSTDRIYERRDSPFGKPNYKRPQITIADNKIFAYTTKVFANTAITFDYIRKPIYPSRFLDTMEQLNSSLMELVLQESIAMGAAILGKQTYQLVRNEDKI